MTTITTSTVTIYQANGKGRGFRVKSAAYRSAAIQRLNGACDRQHTAGYHDRNGETCKYCARWCDGGGRTNGKRARHSDGFTHFNDGDGYTCEADPTHSYRYRLIGRLARWLQWRDKIMARSAEKGGSK